MAQRRVVFWLVAGIAGACYSDRLPEQRTRVVSDAGSGGTSSSRGGTGGQPFGAGGAGEGGLGGIAGAGGSPSPEGGAGSGGAAVSCVVHVDAAANVAIPDGDSWDTAFADLTEAAAEGRARRASAAGPCELWVAAGEYEAPSSGFDLDAVAVLGGFRGDEDSKDDRSPELNAVWLRGAERDRPEHVVRLAADSRLDGVRVSGGQLGILVAGGTVVVRDAFVFDNGPVRAIDVARGNAELDRVRVYDNSSVDTAGGAALRLAPQAELALNDCVFSGNLAGGAATSEPREGGALLLLGRRTRIVRSVFAGNRARTLGGAISNAGELAVSDSVFIGNVANTGSAIVSTASADLRNVTVHGNSGSPALAGALTLVNSIVWGNPDGSLVGLGTFDPEVHVSVIEGNFLSASSEDVIAGDPGLTGARFRATTATADVGETSVVLNHDGLVNAGALRDGFIRFEDGTVRCVLDNQRTNLTLLASTASGAARFGDAQPAGEGGAGGAGGGNSGTANGWEGQSFEILSLELEPGALAIDRGWGDTETHPISDRDLLGRPRRDAPKPDRTTTGTPTYVDLGAYEFQP
jgi:hypothetical protein